jgi:hypothetical protein
MLRPNLSGSVGDANMAYLRVCFTFI